jgi:hypothetical protein
MDGRTVNLLTPRLSLERKKVCNFALLEYI